LKTEKRLEQLFLLLLVVVAFSARRAHRRRQAELLRWQPAAPARFRTLLRSPRALKQATETTFEVRE